MIPWNPIHRYAGMTSLFDSLDEQQPRDVTHVHAEGQGVPEPTRTPLGFIDVRAEDPRPPADISDPTPVLETEVTDAASVAPVSERSEAPALSVVAAVSGGAPDDKVPFYKREISLGRKPENAKPAEQADEKVPFYKREISFRRSAEAPVEPESQLEIVVESGPEATGPSTTDPELSPVLEIVESPSVEVEPATVMAEPVAETPVPMPEPMAIDEVEHEPTPAAVEPEIPMQIPPAIAAASAEAPVAVAQPEQSGNTGKNGKPSASQKKTRGGRKTARKLVGLKIGASQLAAAVVQENGGQHELLELARTPLEPGIVLDGEVRDADALVAALGSFFADQKLPTRDVRIGIASNRIGVRTFDIAGVDDDARFDNAVRFKAHEVLPIAASDSVLDYRVLDERQVNSGETVRRVLLVVAPRDQVVPYVEVAQRAGLKLAGIDLEALGLLRTFVDPNRARVAGGTSTVVVAIGHESSTLLVSGGGTCEFTRVFDWGGSTLQDAIAQELQIHPAEAAVTLRHLSLAGRARRVEGIGEDAANRALEAVRLRLTPFARELVSSLQFYQTQQDSLGIGEIVITGGTSQLDGLADALHQMIGIPVRVGNPLERLTLSKGVESGFEQSLGSLAVAIGLGIDDDPARTVDLTPRDAAKQGRRPNLVPILLPAAAVVSLAAVGLFFSQAHGKVSHRQEALSSLQTTLATLPTPVEPQIDATLATDEAARATAVAQVLGGRTGWDGMLRDLSRVLPANVWLTTMSAEVSSPLSQALATSATPVATPATAAAALPPTPTGVNIVGYTYSQRDVAVLLARLGAVASLQNVQLQSATASTVGKKDVVQFTILADLRGAGGAA